MAPTTVSRVPIALHSGVMVILREPGERTNLEKDLTRIECIRLISKPWIIKDEKMVRKILTGVPNQYKLTICRQSETSTVKK